MLSILPISLLSCSALLAVTHEQRVKTHTARWKDANRRSQFDLNLKQGGFQIEH